MGASSIADGQCTGTLMANTTHPMTGARIDVTRKSEKVLFEGAVDARPAAACRNCDIREKLAAEDTFDHSNVHH